MHLFTGLAFRSRVYLGPRYISSLMQDVKGIENGSLCRNSFLFKDAKLKACYFKHISTTKHAQKLTDFEKRLSLLWFSYNYLRNLKNWLGTINKINYTAPASLSFLFSCVKISALHSVDCRVMEHAHVDLFI